MPKFAYRGSSCLRFIPVVSFALGLLATRHAQAGPTQAAPATVSAPPETKYLPGGPLAGLSLPDIQRPEGVNLKKQMPEYQLYPGSVERWSAYMSKYLPVRSFYDEQSQIKNWVAPEIPVQDGKPAVEQYAAPYWTSPHGNESPEKVPDKFWPAVAVVRFAPNSPAINLDLGELPVGMYVVRVVGAVEPKSIIPLQRKAVLRLKVNDGAGGQESEYRMRIGYVDEFYSVAEFFFQAGEKRRYQATLTMENGSEVPLLIHNISLDDALAGSTWRASKTRTTLGDTPAPPEKLQPTQYSHADRLKRDAALWNGFPPLNTQGSGVPFVSSKPMVLFGSEVKFGADGKTPEQIEAEFGKWQGLYGNDLQKMFSDPNWQDALLINDKLKLKYTLDDLRAHRPLPGPYPYADDGLGIVQRDAAEPENKGTFWSPVASEVDSRIQYYMQFLVDGCANAWVKSGEEDYARDGAIALARYAYAFPALNNSLYLGTIIHNPGAYNRDWSFRRRMTESHFQGHFALYGIAPRDYDMLFPYIKGNQDLADSIGRFVPWVKTPEDVIKLLDVYLVQTTAKRILRYQYSYIATALTTLATIQGDREVTKPWMEWQFSRSFQYPMNLAGIQDLMITGTDRDGCNIGNGGSSYYVAGEGAMSMAEPLDNFVAAGGDPEFRLSDPARYSKPLQQCYWHLGIMTAGFGDLRIGDVSGPDKRIGYHYPLLERAARNGWEWGQDPKFAFLLVNYFGRKTETDAEWAQMTKAAAAVKRAPWLENTSRVMPGWAGVLESGTQHDDYRFRRSVALRVGQGYGHNHSDALDLQIAAHGLPMTIDSGQRLGYTAPSDELTRVHNVVEVDGSNFGGQSWIRALADDPGARYMAARTIRDAGPAAIDQRQVALIDVDEGEGSQALTPAQELPPNVTPQGNAAAGKPAPLPTGIKSANSYVFDVQRLSVGKAHTFNFHAMVNDDFQWNVAKTEPIADATGESQGAPGLVSPAAYLSLFNRRPGTKMTGSAPDVLEATWRYSRKGMGSEMDLGGTLFDAASPQKWTRLHLFGVGGATAMRADAVSKRFDYSMTHIFVQRKAEAGAPNLESVFPSIIEPYAGAPFITASRQLTIEKNESDARRAVALEVKTINGRTDTLFSDGRPDSVRALEGNVRVAGEFGYLSQDAQGLRQATLAGGTIMESPLMRLHLAERERSAKIVKVDYMKKLLWLDAPWPASASSHIMEVQNAAPKGAPDAFNKTSITVVGTQADGKLTRLQTQNTPDYYRSPILDVQAPDAATAPTAPAQTVVQCALAHGLSNNPDGPTVWTATDDKATWFAKAHLVTSSSFGIDADAKISSASFGTENVLRLWEYGPGDTVCQTTSASLQRFAPGIYSFHADSDATLSLKATSIMTSRDRTKWTKAVTTNQAGGWQQLKLAAKDAASPVYLKIVP